MSVKTNQVISNTGNVLDISENIPKYNGKNIVGIGVDQTWQQRTTGADFTTVHTNNTGKPIMINVYMTNGGTGGVVGIVVNNTIIARISGGIYTTISAIVPNGGTYQAYQEAATSPSIATWSELTSEVL